MQLFVGRMLDRPDRCFLAWGRDETEAADSVDPALGKLDVASMSPLSVPGWLKLNAESHRDGSPAREGLKLELQEVDGGLAEIITRILAE